MKTLSANENYSMTSFSKSGLSQNTEKSTKSTKHLVPKISQKNKIKEKENGNKVIDVYLKGSIDMKTTKSLSSSQIQNKRYSEEN